MQNSTVDLFCNRLPSPYKSGCFSSSQPGPQMQLFSYVPIFKGYVGINPTSHFFLTKWQASYISSASMPPILKCAANSSLATQIPVTNSSTMFSYFRIQWNIPSRIKKSSGVNCLDPESNKHFTCIQRDWIRGVGKHSKPVVACLHKR